MDKLIVNTTTLKNSIDVLKAHHKYYDNKKNTFYSSLCGASNEECLRVFLNKINQNYTLIAKNTHALFSFLEDYIEDVEAVEKSFSNLETASFKSASIKAFCLTNSNLLNQIKIDDSNLFQVNRLETLQLSNENKKNGDIAQFGKRAKIDPTLESRMYVNLLNREDLSSITWKEYTILVNGYKKELQNELEVYNDLLDIANEEIEKYKDVKKEIDSWRLSIEDEEMFFENHVNTVVKRYQAIASYNNPKETALLEVELKEKLGISLKEFNSMSKSELINLVVLKDKEEVEKKKDIEKSKKYLESYVKQETEFSSLTEFITYMEEMEQDQLICTSAIKVTENYLDCGEYTFLPLLEDYQNYQETPSSPLEIYKNMSDFEKGLRKSTSGVFTNGLTDFDKLNALERASAINPELEKMYNYLYATQGVESASLYLKNMESSINQINGKHNAELFLDSLKDEKDIGDVLENHVKTLGKGLWEGLESFGEGIESWVTSSTIYSENEYETMYILEAIQGVPKANYDNYFDVLDKISREGIIVNSSPLDQTNLDEDLEALKKASTTDANLANIYNYLYITEGVDSATKYLEEMMPTIEAINTYQEENHKHYDWALKHNFQMTQSMGNMLPSIAISLLLTPAAGASVASTVGSISMGVSAGGKSYHNALVEGHDKPRSVFYGVLSGISEASLQKMVGGIIGVSEVEVVGLKSLANSMLHEGMEEGSQEYIDALLRLGLWGEKTDFIELSGNAFVASIYGSLTAGVMNGSNLALNKAINIGINKSVENQVKQEMQNKLDRMVEGQQINETIQNSLGKKMNSVHARDSLQIEHPTLKIQDVLENRTIRNAYGTELGFDYFNNFLVDDSQYSYLIDSLENASIIKKTYTLEPFHKLNEMIKSEGIEVDEKTQIRLAYLDELLENANRISCIDKAQVINSFGETREIQSDLRATSRTINTDFLFTILTDENVLNALLHDFRTLNSSEEQARINGAIELYEEIVAKQFTITEVMKNHYEILKGYTNRVDDLNLLLKNKNIVSFYGNKYSGTYFNTYLFNDQFYANLLDILNSNDTTRNEKINILSAFHQLYEIINKSENVYFNDKIFTRLNYLNQCFYKTINYNRDAFHSFRQYGVDQDVVRSLALNPSQNEEIYHQCERIVEQYFPFISKQQTNLFLRSINTAGVCSYAVVLNELVSKYIGNETGFKNAFGYDLYRIENDQKILNAELLLTDLYCFVNQKNKNIIKKTGLGLSYKVAKDFSKQIFMSGGTYKNVSILNNWLASKNGAMIVTSDNTCSNWNFVSENNKALFDYIFTERDKTYGIVNRVIDSLANYVMNGLVNGETLSLGVYATPNSGFTLYSTNLSLYDNYFLSADPVHGSGHGIFVTGLTENNDFIVSSWGREYILKRSELKNARVKLNMLIWEENK